MTTSHASIVILPNATGRVLAITNRKYGGYSLPGGKLEPGETPAQAACRELCEETGWDLPVESFHEVFAFPGSAEPDRLVHVFVVRDEAVAFLASTYGEGFTGTEPGTDCVWLTIEDLAAQKTKLALGFRDYAINFRIALATVGRSLSPEERAALDEARADPRPGVSHDAVSRMIEEMRREEEGT